jgi:hypothetical protein
MAIVVKNDKIGSVEIKKKGVEWKLSRLLGRQSRLPLNTFLYPIILSILRR